MSFPSRSGVWTRPVRARRTGSVVWATRHETALLLVAEMVTRGTRPTGITAVIQWSGTAVVAAVAAVVSYGHMRALLLSYGETALVACLLPLSVDGLLLVASVALARPAIPRHGGSAEDHVDPGVHMVPTGPVSLGAEELGTPVPDRHGDGTDSAHDRHGTGEPVPVLAAAAAHEVVTVPPVPRMCRSPASSLPSGSAGRKAGDGRASENAEQAPGKPRSPGNDRRRARGGNALHANGPAL